MHALILVIVLALAAGGALAQGLLLAGQDGDGDDLLCLAGVGDQTTRLYAFARNRWQAVAEVQGQAQAMVVTSGRLHVFFAGRGYRIYEQPDAGRRWTSRPGRLWSDALRDRAVLSACPGGSIRAFPQATAESTTSPATTGEGRVDLYLLLGPPPTAAPAMRPGTTAEALPTTTIAPAVIAAGKPDLMLLGLAGGQWRELARPPGVVLAPMGRAMLADAPDGLYLLGVSPEGRPVGLARFARGAWTVLPPPDWSVADGQVGWLIGLGTDLLLAGGARPDGARQAWLRRLEPRDGEPAGLGEVRNIGGQDKGGPVLLDDAPSAMSRYGRRLALARAAGADWQVWAVDPADGRARALPAAGAGNMAGQPVSRWSTWVLGALAVLLVLAWMVRHRQEAAAPFVLPAGAVPSPWAKRVLAFIVDYTPILALAMMFTGYSRLEQAELSRLYEALRVGEVDDALMVLILASIGLYVLYAILAEGFFGTTIGKGLLRMRVVAGRGRSPTWGQIIVRNLCKPVELLTPAPLVLVFLVWPALSRLHRRVGDVVAGTAVIDVSVRPALVGPAVGPPREGEEPAEPR